MNFQNSAKKVINQQKLTVSDNDNLSKKVVPSKTKTKISDLHRCIIRCSHEIIELDNANLAHLRRGYENSHARPAFWRFFASMIFPKNTLSDLQQYTLFQIIAVLIGTNRELQGGVHDYSFEYKLGRLLAKHSYSESRFLTLLSARNDARSNLLVRAIRYLKTKNVQKVDLCQLGDFLSAQNNDTIYQKMAGDYYSYKKPDEKIIKGKEK